jgi:hypothetical protein
VGILAAVLPGGQVALEAIKAFLATLAARGKDTDPRIAADVQLEGLRNQVGLGFAVPQAPRQGPLFNQPGFGAP